MGLRSWIGWWYISGFETSLSWEVSQARTTYGIETMPSTSRYNTMATNLSAQQHVDKNGQESDIKLHPTPVIPQRQGMLLIAKYILKQ